MRAVETKQRRTGITPSHIRFKDVELGQKKNTSFVIRNVGGPYSKIWIDDSPVSWLSVTNLKSVTNKELPLEVTIEVTGIGEPDKIYACNLRVRLENEQTKSRDQTTVKVELCLRLKPAILEAKANSIEVKNAQPSSTEVRAFELSNIGSGPLQAQITTTKPWLSVVPDSATIAPATRNTFIVRIATKHLPCGFTDEDLIRINTNGGNAQLPVNLSIAPANNRVKTREPTTSSFSFKKFMGALIWFIFVPVMPPILLIINVLFSSFGHEVLFWLSLGVYVAVALVVSYRKGRRKEKRFNQIPTRPSKSIKATAGQIKVSVVANRFRGIYHRSWCIWAKITSSSNRVYLAREEAKRRGYNRCKVCRP